MSRMIPRGHEVAALGRRLLAALIDAAPVAIFVGLLTFALQMWQSPTVVLVASITASVLTLGYALIQWWAYATRGAGIGARATGLELVGLSDGKPIGWWRVFLRFLIAAGLVATVVGGIAFVVFLVIHERRQGWHDMAVGSVVVQPRHAATATSRAAARVRRPVPSTVGLPPHLAEPYSPEARQAQTAWAPQLGQQWQSEPEPWGQPRPSAHSLPPPQQPQPWSSQAPFSQPSVGGPGGYVQPPAPAEFPAPQPSAPSQPPPGPGFPASGPLAQPNGPGHPHAAPDAAAMSARVQQPGWIPMPTPSSVLEPSQKSVRVRPRAFGDVDEEDGTTIAALPQRNAERPGDEGWYLRLDDGREVEMTVTVLLGRNPQRAPQDPEVQLVPSSGDGRMISRTHVLIGTDLRGVFVVDRGSTNGTALVTDTGELEPAPTGVQMRVREGQQVSYGNRWFTVLRRPAQPR